MSRTHETHNENMNGKVIEIKPIKLIQCDKEPGDSTRLDVKNKSVQFELQKAQKKLSDLQQQKETLLQETVAEIKREKEVWEKEKIELTEKARESGFNKGFTTGKQESKAKYNHLLKKANSIVHDASKDYHATLEQSDEMIVKLAIHTAEKIIKQKLTDHPEVFLDIVVGAIKEIKDQANISIYLHPDDYKHVIKQKDELVNELDGDSQISIYIDQEMGKSGCRIEHPFGQVDASIETQLEQIRNVLNAVAMEKKQ